MKFLGELLFLCALMTIWELCNYISWNIGSCKQCTESKDELEVATLK